MKCPFCGHLEDRVLDSRSVREGEVIRRRRECEYCGRRYTTYERVEDIPYMVIKKDGRREPFDRVKLLNGILKACEKRPIGPSAVEKIVEGAESLAHSKPDREIASRELGEFVIDELYKLDGIAYIRFASVHLTFKDLDHMMEAIQSFLARNKQ
ncbi:transcriptional repressor NrdR [bacterium]|nr:transcriptional repressor NrdR [candidate division CSSED10-310 bacterium]